MWLTSHGDDVGISVVALTQKQKIIVNNTNRKVCIISSFCAQLDDKTNQMLQYKQIITTRQRQRRRRRRRLQTNTPPIKIYIYVSISPCTRHHTTHSLLSLCLLHLFYMLLLLLLFPIFNTPHNKHTKKGLVVCSSYICFGLQTQHICILSTS